MKEFFDILINTSNEKLRTVNFLKIRGFLLDERNSSWYVSDNSHIKDFLDLNDILTQNHMGEVDEYGKVIIHQQVTADVLECLFKHKHRVQFESESNYRDWQWFRRREHGYKIPTMDLDPFIAMYVKAISACGIETWFSCDGNNHRDYAIEIGMNGLPNIFWHKVLWEKLLATRFELPWEREYQYIPLYENKFKIYAELNKAAMFLYNYRMQLRDLKKNVMSIITPATENRLSNKEIEGIIQLRVDDFLNKHIFLKP